MTTNNEVEPNVIYKTKTYIFFKEWEADTLNLILFCYFKTFIILLLFWVSWHEDFSKISSPYLCFCWQSFNFLDKKSVWLEHDDQRYASGLLHTAHQAWVIHYLRPLTQSRWHFTTATIRAEKKKRESESDWDISTSKCLRRKAIKVLLTLWRWLERVSVLQWCYGSQLQQRTSLARSWRKASEAHERSRPTHHHQLPARCYPGDTRKYFTILQPPFGILKEYNGLKFKGIVMDFWLLSSLHGLFPTHW